MQREENALDVDLGLVYRVEAGERGGAELRA